MRAFGLYLAEVVLGGARDPEPVRSGGSAGEGVAPLDATTLAAWRAWAARGSTSDDAATPAGDTALRRPDSGRLIRPATP